MNHPIGLPDAIAQLNRTLIFGILNVTPDSFSDGGKFLDPTSAINHAKQLVADGADVIDVGGESTRPGAERISTADELTRVIPVIQEVSQFATVSIDTMRAEVAAAAVASGAKIVNDVSGGLADAEMVFAVAELQVPYVCMHWRNHSADMYENAKYDSVVLEVIEELEQRVAVAMGAGIEKERIILDPGLGFAKLPEHNWQLVAEITTLNSLGFPLLVGASRKKFLRELGVDQDAATHALNAYLAANRIWAVRVHDVVGTAIAITALAEVMETNE
jgi:dihydropteroate synthase